MRKSLLCALFIFGTCLLYGHAPVSAQASTTTPNQKTVGLTISPLRTNPTITAGNTKVQKITVQNRTKEPMDVTLSYEQFTLSSETYDYSFSPPKDNILTFENNQLSLQPHERKSVAYQITVPDGYPSGGYYFSIFATNITTNGSLSTQSRVGSLVFLTVDGVLDRTTVIKEADAPNITARVQIPITLRLQNTGNVHSQNTVTTSLTGPLTSNTVTALHLVMPDTTRLVQYSITAPRMPGIYTISITVNNGYSQPSSTTLQVLYVPLWFIIVVGIIAILLLSAAHARRQRRAQKAPHDKDTPPPADQNVSGTAV